MAGAPNETWRAGLKLVFSIMSTYTKLARIRKGSLPHTPDTNERPTLHASEELGGISWVHVLLWLLGVPTPASVECYERRMAPVIDGLTKAGYRDTFRGESGGLRAVRAGHIHRPEDLVVESIERFEGDSDPYDAVLVLALGCPADGCRGTYTVPYGKNMSALDSDLVERIPDARSTHARPSSGSI